MGPREARTVAGWQDRRRMMDTGRVRERINRRCRGVTAVTVAISLPVILGFAALAIDVGYIHNAKIDLQTATDASALAGASGLAHINNLDGGDIEIGYLADPDDPTQPLDRSNPLLYNAVRVTARRTGNSPGGPVELFFARAMGIDSSELTATATSPPGPTRSPS